MKPNRRNDVRVALLANLVAAHSMLKDAHERKISPNKTMGSDKMFVEMLGDMEKTIDRARAEIWPPEPEITDEDARKAQAKEDLKKLNGDRPYDDGSNLVRGDGVFANSLVEKYGMSLGKLAVWSDYRNSGGKPFWDSPTSIEYLLTHKDDEEVKRVLAPMSIRALTPADWKAIYKCRDRLWKAENAKPEGEAAGRRRSGSGS